MILGAILVIKAEIPQAHELEARRGLALLFGLVVRRSDVAHTRLDLAATQHLKRIGIHAGKEVLIRAVGRRVAEQLAVNAHLGIERGRGIDPVDRRTLDLAAVGGIAARGVRVVLGVDLDDVAVFVLLAARAGDEVCALETALRAVRRQTLVLGHRDFHEIVGLDPALAGEGDLVRAGRRIGRVVLDRDGLALALGIVRDDELHRVQHTHRTLQPFR